MGFRPVRGSATPHRKGAWLTPRNMRLPTCFLPNLVVLGHTVRALLRRSAWKKWPLASCLKITWGHRNRHGSIGYPWLPINVLQQGGLPRTVSEINSDFSLKLLNFPTLRVHKAPAMGAFLGIGYQRLGLKQLEWWGRSTRSRKKLDEIFSHLDTIHKRVGQTDGRTDTCRQQRPCLRIASRGKKLKEYYSVSL